MVKITKKVVEAAEAGEKDYLIWDDELPGFGLRVFSSGKRSYVIQYRTRGRSRRYTIGLHGAWAPETERREAKVQLGRVAGILAICRPGSSSEREGDRKRLRRSPPILAVLSATSSHFWGRGESRISPRPTSTRS
jgi:hypothetical protein